MRVMELISAVFRLAWILAVRISNYTVVRLPAAAIMFPTYLLVAFLRSLLPYLAPQVPGLVLSQKYRDGLAQRGMANREAREDLALRQLRGEYRFPDGEVRRTRHDPAERRRIEAALPGRREFVKVCPGVEAAVLRAGNEGGPKALLLHGNPSWSYMYRNIIPMLVENGFDVYALDWVGFGMSDKILVAEHISFDLHMRTLMNVLETFDLTDTHVLAHDWGGCIALCTLPLVENRVKSLQLLNSFFPPRPTEVNINSLSLYYIWLSTQGLLDGLVPERLVIDYMAPEVDHGTTEGYSSQFSGPREKKAVYRFAFLAPGLPSPVYEAFHRTRAGLMLDGLCPPETFSSLHEQLRLRLRDRETRAYWGSGRAPFKVALVFGHEDPLLRDYRDVLHSVIRTKEGEPDAMWLKGAGHYPNEEKPTEIAKRFVALVRHRTIF
ncbi:epoxide hydrolase [Xylariaceae sp. FL0804]|nr:epoxide hydrolase [Xylariaceae sp. FL0804]